MRDLGSGDVKLRCNYLNGIQGKPPYKSKECYILANRVKQIRLIGHATIAVVLKVEFKAVFLLGYAKTNHGGREFDFDEFIFNPRFLCLESKKTIRIIFNF